MAIAGIIGEYNPFHNGHQYHFRATKEKIGECCEGIVCVMSGNFVQRGEAAVLDKFYRAEMAVSCGADLVFELPVPWALSSAEGFARGAVGLLDALGIVTHLSFGSEIGELTHLEETVQLLEEADIHEDIRRYMQTGISYPDARQRALYAHMGPASAVLEHPNNILAVEYLKALRLLQSNMIPITMDRIGSGHDADAGPGSFQSASALRRMLYEGAEISEYMPPEAYVILMRALQDKELVFMPALETALLSRLRFLSEEDFARLPDATEGLGNRLFRSVRETVGWEEMLMRTKSRRYALSRIRRMAMCAALGVRAGDSAGIPPYARVLAMNDRGRRLLRGCKGNSGIPVLTKTAAVRELPERAQRIFARECAADDFYALAYSGERRMCGMDWKKGPVRILSGKAETF